MRTKFEYQVSMLLDLGLLPHALFSSIHSHHQQQHSFTSSPARPWFRTIVCHQSVFAFSLMKRWAPPADSTVKKYTRLCLRCGLRDRCDKLLNLRARWPLLFEAVLRTLPEEGEGGEDEVPERLLLIISGELGDHEARGANAGLH